MPESESTTASLPAAGAAESAPVSLRDLTVRGTLWTIAGFAGNQALRFAFNLILTHLLVPEFFGLMTMVWAIATGVNLFCDLGIGPAVIRDPRGDSPAFLNTAWTLQIARGFCIALGFLLLARPVASFYGDPRLVWILPVVGLNAIVSGFYSTSLLTLQRHMKVRRLVALELGAQAVSGLTMVGWACFHPSIWALIAGAPATVVVRMAGSHFLVAGHKDRIGWERAALRQIVVFGRWIWAGSALMFLASQIDRLILAKLLSLEMLGVYSIAAAIAEVPRALAQAINQNVLFPAYSKSSHLARAELRAKILRHRWRLLVVMAFAVAPLAAGGDALILLIYDKRYAAGAWMLPLLAIGVWPNTLAHTIDSSLAAVDRPHYAAYGNFLKVLFTAIGIPLGYSLAGTAGAIIVVALNDLPYYAQISYGLWREGLNCFTQDLKATLLLAGLLALALTARYALGVGIQIPPLASGLH